MGAIFLGSVQSDFVLDDEQGSTKGVLAKSGLFLFEDGCGGNISHIDFATQKLYG